MNIHAAYRLPDLRASGACALLPTGPGLEHKFAALYIGNKTYASIAFIVLVQLNFAFAPRLRWLSRI